MFQIQELTNVLPETECEIEVTHRNCIFFYQMENVDFTESYWLGYEPKCWFKMTWVKWRRRLLLSFSWNPNSMTPQNTPPRCECGSQPNLCKYSPGTHGSWCCRYPSRIFCSIKITNMHHFLQTFLVSSLFVPWREESCCSLYCVSPLNLDQNKTDGRESAC